MSLELHDAHEFAWLTAPIRYTAAQDLHPRLKRQCTAVACRPPRGLTPRGWSWFPAPPPVGVGGVVVDGGECWLMES